MKVFKNSLLVLLSCFAFLGLQGCDNDSALEDAGEEIDQGIDNTGDALDDAGDEIDDEL